MQGFFTIAFGEKYHKLACNLLLSYKMNGGIDLPFFVIADNKDKYLKEFDGVIIVEPTKMGYMNKLNIYEYLPFEENIFIDSDCLIYNSLKDCFAYFSNSGYSITSLGINEDITIKDSYFSYDTAKKLGLDYKPSFNSGILYLRKDETTKQVMDDALRLSSDGNEYGVPFIGDEPYISLAMAINNQKCINPTNTVRMMWYPRAIVKKINILKKELVYMWEGGDKELFLACIAHFATANTLKTLYRQEIMRLKHRIISKLIITYFFLVIADKTRSKRLQIKYLWGAVFVSIKERTLIIKVKKRLGFKP